MKEVFFVNWSPEDAEKVAALIAKKAGEARKTGKGAEVMLRFVTDAEKQRSSVNVAVLPPEIRLVVDNVENDL